MTVGTLEDIVDDNHAIVSIAGGQLPFYVPILSIVDKDRLEPNCKVLLSKKGFVVVGVLDNDFSLEAMKMRLETAPQETFADIGECRSHFFWDAKQCAKSRKSANSSSLGRWPGRTDPRDSRSD